MKRTILLIMLAVALFSCSTNRSALNNEYIQGQSFTGVLPCDNCNGIKQVIILDSNNTFRLQETYIGKDEPGKEKKGSWSFQEGKVMLYSDSSMIAQYAITGDKLVYIDEANYASKKNRKNSNTAALAKKIFTASKKINPEFLEGIDISASGDNGWKLEIDHEREILFNAGTGTTLRFSSMIPTLSGDSLIYDIHTGGDDISIILTPGFYNDDISNSLYDYKVTIRHNGKIMQGGATIKNTEGSLTGTWLFDNVEGETVSIKDQPYVIVDLAAEKFYGGTGCNNFNGTVRMRGTKICFSDIAFTTQRDCSYDENKLIEALIKCNGYSISEGRMTMTCDGQPVLLLQRQVADYL